MSEDRGLVTVERASKRYDDHDDQDYRTHEIATEYSLRMPVNGCVWLCLRCCSCSAILFLRVVILVVVRIVQELLSPFYEYDCEEYWDPCDTSYSLHSPFISISYTLAALCALGPSKNHKSYIRHQKSYIPWKTMRYGVKAECGKTILTTKSTSRGSS